MTLTPAYGRDYKSAKSARQAYQAGVDFIINQFGHPYDGKPINKSQLDAEGVKPTLRFSNLRKVCVA